MASDAATTTTSDATISPESAYHDLRRLIPSLASELDSLRTSLREHNLWLLRYGHSSSADDTPLPTTSDLTEPKLPSYTPSNVPPYSADLTSVRPSTREDVQQRRDQIVEWLHEGESVLREYSGRFEQLGAELHMPFEDVLGTWAESDVDNALPDYEQVEEREELMVAGVGEVPPPYVGGAGKSGDKAKEPEQ